MRFAELLDRRLLPAAALAALLAVAGATLVLLARHGLASARQQLFAARTEHAQAREQLARIAQEGQEVREQADLYRRLVELRIVGAERRLEWNASLAGIRERLQLPQMRYQIAPRRLLQSLPGKAGNVDSHASTMKLELGLLHEVDLLRFLEALRTSGNAFYAVNQCAIARNAPGAAGAPLLRAACEIDLITIHDGGSRT